jgi:hypothetical protein
VTSGTLRVTFADPADTLRGGTTTTPFHVRVDTDAFSLSDVVIADPGNTGLLVRGSRRIAPIPEHRIQPGDAYRVFAELYGAAAGEELVVTAQLKRRRNNASLKEQLRLTQTRDERTITFKQSAVVDARGVAFIDVDVSGDLIPGTYVVELSVKSPKATASRTATLIVE